MFKNQKQKKTIIKKPAELNQPVYFKEALAPEENRKCVMLGRGYDDISTEKEKLWVPFKLIKMRHVKGRPPEYLGYGEGKGD